MLRALGAEAVFCQFQVREGGVDMQRCRQLRCALVSEVVAKQVQLREDIIRAQPPQRALEFVCTGAGAGYRRATPRRCGCFCLKGCKVPVLGCRVGTVPE